MEKRPTRIDLLFSLGFILLLICAIGAFFYGMKTGAERTEAKYEAQIAETVLATKTGNYPQQDLVSFYHTVLLPYREFQQTWFKSLDALNSGDPTTDNSDILKAVGKMAEQQYENANRNAVPGTSPLLQSAQTNYLKGLKLFSKGTNHWINKANTLPGPLVAEQIEKDEYIQNAVKYFLTAQNQMYSSVLKWSSSVQPSIPNQLTMKQTISISEWKNYSLAVKNTIITNLLLKQLYYEPYYPQDLSAKIDQMILNGQASKLKLNNINEIFDLLIHTDAVQTNDFLKHKGRLYSKEVLPQLPFFYE